MSRKKSKAILVASFGTSNGESRDLTIGAVETAIESAFPDHDVRRAFTSQMIINILAKRDGLEIDNVGQALGRLTSDEITELIVQPTHLMSGFEYDDLVREVRVHQDRFNALAIGNPLLTSDIDFADVISVITEDTALYSNNETAVVFIGHGTEHKSNRVYKVLQEKIAEAGFANYFIGTVEAEPGLEDVLEKVRDGEFKNIVLQPLMVVAGDHAINDMAGDDGDSWKTAFEKAGFTVEAVLKGLGQSERIQQVYVRHVQDAIDSFSDKVL